MRKLYQRLVALRLAMVIFAAAIAVRLAYLISIPNYQAVAQQQGTFTIQTPVTNANIYDTDFELLVNDTNQYIAMLPPTASAVSAVLPYVPDKAAFYAALQYHTPFSCEITVPTIENPEVTVFSIPIRNQKRQLAQHLIGYLRDGVGVTGIEAAYDTILRGISSVSTVTFSVSGNGSVLEGESRIVHTGQKIQSGVVLTLEKNVQTICEAVGTEMGLEMGCIIVMEVQTGDILGMASFPDYTIDTLAEAMESEQSPLIDRALYAYPVGSIFKLIPAACAVEQNLDTFQYRCKGEISIDSQLFHCHDANGHGKQNLQQAMIHSCNPYFIALSQKLSAAKLFSMAQRFGFGEEIPLCEQIIAESGCLPDLQALQIAAEKANFCFGQGMLTATPLQIARMTCAIANHGQLPAVRLVRGITTDGYTIIKEAAADPVQAVAPETADYLQRLMIATAYGSATFQGLPENTTVGVKTSTAQTGRYDENGVEYCDGWVTGFFPVDSPQYVVTVLAENGGYGNDAAAPIFRELINRLQAAPE